MIRALRSLQPNTTTKAALAATAISGVVTYVVVRFEDEIKGFFRGAVQKVTSACRMSTSLEAHQAAMDAAEIKKKLL
jgi:hypothetical protein